MATITTELTREDFTTKLRKGIIAEASKKYEIEDVRVMKVNKNNQQLEGINVKVKGIAIAPIIYVDNAWEHYLSGKADDETIIQDVAEAWMKSMENIPAIDVNFVTNYENVKSKLIYTLVNKANNDEFLQQMAHVDYLDLAVVFKIDLGNLTDKDEAKGTIPVTNQLVDNWGVTVEQVYADAKENTPSQLGLTVNGIMETILSLIDGSELQGKLDELDMEFPMIVATNLEKMYGAGVILYPNMLKTLADKLQRNLYIIPSSIHEVIIVRDEPEMDPMALTDMIKQVNDTELKPEEILSYSLYHYDRTADELGICCPKLQMVD